MSDMTLSARLHAERKRLGIAASAMSRAAGLSAAVVGQIERGQTESPTLKTLEKLCAYLQCDVGWLVSGEGRPPARGAGCSEEAA